MSTSREDPRSQERLLALSPLASLWAIPPFQRDSNECAERLVVDGEQLVEAHCYGRPDQRGVEVDPQRVEVGRHCRRTK